MPYEIRKRVLARWARENSVILAREGPRTTFRFCYRGCTCVNGGTEFTAHIDLTLADEGGRYRVVGAVITLDPEGTGVPVSCHYEASQREDFVARNVAHSGVIGADLEEFLQADHALNPAGCFCSVEHVNHKLLIALQTIRFFLEQPRFNRSLSNPVRQGR